MEPIEILKKIIDEDGSCDWVGPGIGICNDCPLGKNRNHEQKRNMSCIEAININGLSDKDANCKYKRAALDKLADLMLEQILEDECGTKCK